MWRAILQWLREHFIGMSVDPEQTKEKHVDNQGGAVGFRWRF